MVFSKPMSLVVVFFQSYFCGQGDECIMFNSMSALSLAKRHVEEHYPLVGVLERLTETLQMMELYYPKHVKGIARLYTSKSELQSLERHPLN